jgi:hypothetical protein
VFTKDWRLTHGFSSAIAALAVGYFYCKAWQGFVDRHPIEIGWLLGIPGILLVVWFVSLEFWFTARKEANDRPSIHLNALTGLTGYILAYLAY